MKRQLFALFVTIGFSFTAFGNCLFGDYREQAYYELISHAGGFEIAIEFLYAETCNYDVKASANVWKPVRLLKNPFKILKDGKVAKDFDYLHEFDATQAAYNLRHELEKLANQDEVVTVNAQ